MAMFDEVHSEVEVGKNHTWLGKTQKVYSSVFIVFIVQIWRCHLQGLLHLLRSEKGKSIRGELEWSSIRNSPFQNSIFAKKVGSDQCQDFLWTWYSLVKEGSQCEVKLWKCLRIPSLQKSPIVLKWKEISQQRLNCLHDLTMLFALRFWFKRETRRGGVQKEENLLSSQPQCESCLGLCWSIKMMISVVIICTNPCTKWSNYTGTTLRQVLATQCVWRV